MPNQICGGNWIVYLNETQHSGNEAHNSPPASAEVKEAWI
jgi:hypothetical protein